MMRLKAVREIGRPFRFGRLFVGRLVGGQEVIAPLRFRDIVAHVKTNRTEPRPRFRSRSDSGAGAVSAGSHSGAVRDDFVGVNGKILKGIGGNHVGGT